MGNIAIIYASVHHNNTKKLVEGIALKCDVDLFDVFEASNIDLTHYKIIGFASGIYMSAFHKSLFDFIENHTDLPNKSFLMYTSGSGSQKYAETFKKQLEMQNITVIGVYNCKGYDTYGVWKLIDGISKKHPSQKDISKGIDFIDKVVVGKI
ncbi:MAG: flavodoxin [Haloplasmataceae bacterium]|jgi:flavodoxin|nr:flavodoxin [Haloplasmataceae bacterium]